MNCPDCRKPLDGSATSCRCGWQKAGNTGRPFVHCAHETCDLPATIRQKTPTGWANLCEPHYVRYHDDLARKRFTELGLDRQLNETHDEHRKRVMAHIKAKPKTFEDAVKAEDDWAA